MKTMRSASFCHHRFAAMAALAIGGACSTSANASPPRDETAVAQALFDQAMTLKERGRYVEACPKLEESQRIDPGLGTQYHLADCYEKQGRTAAAWTLFGELARMAAVSGQKDRESVARERAAEIAPRMPRLMIAVPADSDAGGLAIMLDGAVVPRASWNMPQPIDPGSHEVVARVGKRSWRTTVTFDARARADSIVVPDLLERDAKRNAQATTGSLGAPVTTTALVSPAVARVVDEPARESTDDRRRMVGIGLTAAGLIGLGAGTFFAVRLFGDPTPSEAARNVAITSFAIGAVATSAGVYLILSARGAERQRPRAFVRATASGVDLVGSF